MGKDGRGHWIFANKSAGHYDRQIWDHGTIVKTKRYCLRESERNRRRVKPGDVAILRIFGTGYVGRFEVGEWLPGASPRVEETEPVHGFFQMRKLEIWKRELPQSLIFKDLSNADVRSRLIRITAEDVLKIETAQRVYERLGYGAADGEIILLEKGIEDAIKPNLSKLGLKLAPQRIAEQFYMGPGVGRSDLICQDADGNLVVLELKRGRSSDEVVGQVLRYIQYVRENIAKPDQTVHGCIVVGEYDEGLRLAAAAANIRLLVVRLP